MLATLKERFICNLEIAEYRFKMEKNDSVITANKNVINTKIKLSDTLTFKTTTSFYLIV